MENEQTQEVTQEHDRLLKLFEGADDTQKALADGLIWEAAKMRVQLREMNKVVEKTGFVHIDPKNPLRQKELPISRVMAKVRANYVAYIQRIRSLMDVEVDEEDDDLAEYE